MSTTEREVSESVGTYVPAVKQGTMATIRGTSCGIYAETTGEICIHDAVASFVAGADLSTMKDLYATLGAAIDEAVYAQCPR